jgi:hypothetical protein
VAQHEVVVGYVGRATVFPGRTGDGIHSLGDVTYVIDENLLGWPIQRGHAAPLREVLERGASRGDIPATADPSRMISALMGPLYYRRWFSREPIDDQFVKMIVRSVISSQFAP